MLQCKILAYFLHAHLESSHYGRFDFQLLAHTRKCKNITVFKIEEKKEIMNIKQLRRTTADKGRLEFERLHSC